ncbi:putative mannan synthase 4 [Apostasia shenzhenica]|uniref:glucomannan 4-beta-mannosyltransferase n=1 Tax=Apostasia shenzhenica TaxID=1088818 RepID=A0A2H9ZUZ4_9ASPA|nr:putative mannan synthase 4 [Apostasia shenzhenica]
MEARALGGATFLLLLASAASAAPAANGAGEMQAENRAVALAGSIVRNVKAMVRSTDGMLPNWYHSAWDAVRLRAIAPAMWAAVMVCLALSVMLMVEALFMSAVSLAVRLLQWTPEKRYKWEPLGGDLEAGSSSYPMVLIQIPMYNEKEWLLRNRCDLSCGIWEQVYKLSIGAACGLLWPSDRMIIQVLDDSTDPNIKDLVELECKIWASKGMNIAYEVRDNRKGYKAGALKEGMQHSYVEQCDYVAIFDADFQPESDFLTRTIPFLVHNPKLALVQSRWEFVNPNECLMTRIQRVTLDYHFKVEQEAGSSTYAFFGFNGTAGVWRISAIKGAGGWNDRTTVEDMDLAIRASLRGWKFVYVGDLKVMSELPSSFKAYRYQQHRWTCGAANLFRKTAFEIWMTKEVSFWKKLYLLYSFFIVRKVVSHVVTFTLYCVIIPASVFVPEIKIPSWGVICIPTTITLLNAIRNISSIHIIPFWILFENVMAMHRMKATIVGLWEGGRANEWVVTEKLGGTLKEKLLPEAAEIEKPSSCTHRFYFSELGFAVFLLVCASYDLTFGGDYYFVYIYLQSLAFFVVGFGYVGSFISSS